MAKKILISTLGTRGEVQPALALALEIRRLGNEAVLCVAPNFKNWIESHGVQFVPLGPDMQKYMAASASAASESSKAPAKQARPSRAVMRKMVGDSVVEQFKITPIAAQGCDLILTAGDLQHAGKSIAETLKIPHVHATYCPVTLRSPRHTPPNMFWLARSQTLPGVMCRALWKASDAQWNAMFRESLNEQRSALGLAPVKSAPRYIANEHSWVAADGVLAPANDYEGTKPLQTGAWMLRDERPLPGELEEFLTAGQPPIYFGFGSMRRDDGLNRMLIDAARAVGRRAIVSKGWGGFDLIGGASDTIAIDDVSHEKLFPRVAVIVHHGGAGTTTTAARAGRPQVIVPHMYDQYYWAHRVEQLGIGSSAGRSAKLSLDKLTSALNSALHPSVAEQARSVATRIEANGARIAAERLVAIA